MLERDPNWDALPPTSIAVKGILRRCLEKEVHRRLRDIADVRQWLEETAAEVRPLTVPVNRSHRIRWSIAGLVLGLAIGGSSIWLVTRRHGESVRQVGHFIVTSSQSGPLTADTYGSNVAISPDGSRIVYTVTQNGVPMLAVRRLDQLEGTTLAGTEGGTFPFFSADNNHIGFATVDALKRVPVEGGAVVTICPVRPAFAARRGEPTTPSSLASTVESGSFALRYPKGFRERLLRQTQLAGKKTI